MNFDETELEIFMIRYNLLRSSFLDNRSCMKTCKNMMINDKKFKAWSFSKIHVVNSMDFCQDDLSDINCCGIIKDNGNEDVKSETSLSTSFNLINRHYCLTLIYLTNLSEHHLLSSFLNFMMKLFVKADGVKQNGRAQTEESQNYVNYIYGLTT